MEEVKEMDFGKKYRIGNFECIKVVRSLSKRELAALRDEANIPKDVRKHLQRGGLPFMTVQSVSGNWSISFVISSVMYHFIEMNVMNGEEGKHSLVNLFTMMYADTTIMGDQEYWKAKSDALHAFLERQKAKDVSDDDDKKELDTLKTEEEARENIKEMADELNKNENGK